MVRFILLYFMKVLSFDKIYEFPTQVGILLGVGDTQSSWVLRMVYAGYYRLFEIYEFTTHVEIY